MLLGQVSNLMDITSIEDHVIPDGPDADTRGSTP